MDQLKHKVSLRQFAPSASRWLLCQLGTLFNCAAPWLGFVVAFGCGDASEWELPDQIEDKIGQLVVWNTSLLTASGQTEPNSYIIGFNLAPNPKILSLNNHPAEFAATFASLDQLFTADPAIADYQYITSLDRKAPEKSGQALSLDPFSIQQRVQWGNDSWDPDITTMIRVDFRSETAATETLKRWAQEGRIHFAEPNYLNQLHQSGTASCDQETGLFEKASCSYTSLFASAWWIRNIYTEEAFSQLQARQQDDFNSDLSLTARPPVIAIMDSGVDYQHDSLRNKIWENEKIGASSCINDRFGCNTTRATKGNLGTGDVHPYLTPGPGAGCETDDAVKKGTCQHGTHVAGIAVGEPKQEGGGICPVCKIMVLRVVKESDGGIPDSAILNAFKYITLFKRNNAGLVKVVNASLGKFQRSKAVGLMVRLLRGSGQGILVVGAAGNEDTMTRSYPAAFSDAIAVSAVDDKGRKAAYSNYGVWVDIAAPGGSESVPINSTVPGGLYFPLQGTSMAAPVVSGVAGLLIAQNPNISFSALRNTLLSSANRSLYEADSEDAQFNRRNYYRKVTGDSVRRPMLGSGVLDAKAAVAGESNALEIPGLGKRVEPGCGSVGLGTTGGPPRRLPPQPSTPLILLLLPLAVLMPMPQRRRSR